MKGSETFRSPNDHYKLTTIKMVSRDAERSAFCEERKALRCRVAANLGLLQFLTFNTA